MQSFFKHLNRDLKAYGLGVPQLIVDETALKKNLQFVQSQLQIATHLKPRLVVKSLANLALLQTISAALSTNRFMVFHIHHLPDLLTAFKDADLLFGKPMPIRAVENFYSKNLAFKNTQIHWLIDQFERLEQYLELAKRLKLRLKINLEIDVGLRRGGIRSLEDFGKILDLIRQHHHYLELSGLMGYDAHVTKLPKVIKKADKAYSESQSIYSSYLDFFKTKFAGLYHDQLCLNGGGSPTFNFHVKHSVCNDLSFGSMLLKPSDFDTEHLSELQPALFIAAPVLKVFDQIELPSMPSLNQFKFIKKQQAVFIYGGYWMGQYVYPPKTHPHGLYGRSTNQEMVCVAQEYRLNIDDYVFVRPSQSEMIIPQFSHLYLYREYQDDSFVAQPRFEQWESFRE